jgi:hypothetical protein
MTRLDPRRTVSSTAPQIADLVRDLRNYLA